MRKITFILCIATGIFFCSFSAKETVATDSGREYEIPVEKRDEKEDSRLSSQLRSVLVKMKTMGVTRSNVQDFKPEELSTPLVKFNQSGDVQAYIHLLEVNEDNLNQLLSLGVTLEIARQEYKIAQAWVPFDKLEELASLDFVEKVTPPDYGKTRTGSVNTEGDAILGSDDVRGMLGFDGSGVKVCVISDGVDSIASSQATGDLPDDIEIDPSLPGNGDEGTALMEIIHDIAPGAQLLFSGPNTSLEMIDSIDFCTANSDVIVDDLGFLGEPFFADGRIAQAAEDAVNQGRVFVSATGNDADQHYQAQYQDTDPADDENNLHNFGLAAGRASDVAMRVSIPPGRTIIFVLQWNDRFGQSSNDYDLFLFNASTGEIIDFGTDVQNGDDNPIESAGIINTSSSSFAQVDIVINRFSGQARTLEIFFNGPVIPEEFNVPEDSIWGHPAVPGVIAVGAVPISNPSTIEPFSSQGPVTISFPSQERPKPDVVAPDGVSTSVPGFDPFFGTSAAAPHVAGVAALMLDKNGSLSSAQVRGNLIPSESSTSVRQADTPSEVLNILGDTAIDLGQPGFDNVFGFGRVDAFQAVEAVTEGDDGGQDGDGDNSGCSLAYKSAGSRMAVLSNMFIILIPTLFIGLRKSSGKFWHRNRL
jgi:subtilisin family serine protease